MDRRLIFVPIEPLKERYSEQWLEWFLPVLPKGARLILCQSYGKIRTGQFLDVMGTNEFKARQMSQIINVIMDAPKEKYTIFFMDMWYPGIESLFYIRDAGNIDIKICGMLHAGTYDPNDFLTQKICVEKKKAWANIIETAWFNEVDDIIVATQYHKRMLIDERYVDGNKIHLLPWPVYQDDELRKTEKENMVVFPHRMAPEKDPESFNKIERIFREKYKEAKTKFVRTKDICSNKKDYYHILSRSKVAVSTALQETFGIAMQEARNLGCIPVAPKRLSYPETIPDYPLYETLEQAADLIHQSLLNYAPPIPRYKSQPKEIMEWILEHL